MFEKFIMVLELKTVLILLCFQQFGNLKRYQQINKYQFKQNETMKEQVV